MCVCEGFGWIQFVFVLQFVACSKTSFFISQVCGQVHREYPQVQTGVEVLNVSWQYPTQLLSLIERSANEQPPFCVGIDEWQMMNSSTTSTVPHSPRGLVAVCRLLRVGSTSMAKFRSME